MRLLRASPNRQPITKPFASSYLAKFPAAAKRPTSCSTSSIKAKAILEDRSCKEPRQGFALLNYATYGRVCGWLVHAIAHQRRFGSEQRQKRLGMVVWILVLWANLHFAHCCSRPG